MFPYIVINGISSKTINGLVIQSLPPITKPKIRVQTEEIDGRDGDIVNRLGFSAYDKTISIGLKGDFDIDDVIEYFNTRGKITFSNEIDKYYKFAIYDAIDFERLVRFRTANVNIHVQPFKYSIEEPPITKTNPRGLSIITVPVWDHGNIYAKPKIIIRGRKTITVYINKKQILSITLNNDNYETIIIDADTMNATDENGNYQNRKVVGDYNNMILEPGKQEVMVTGDLNRVTIENYSRWL